MTREVDEVRFHVDRMHRESDGKEDDHREDDDKHLPKVQRDLAFKGWQTATYLLSGQHVI